MPMKPLYPNSLVPQLHQSGDFRATTVSEEFLAELLQAATTDCVGGTVFGSDVEG